MASDIPTELTRPDSGLPKLPKADGHAARLSAAVNEIEMDRQIKNMEGTGDRLKRVANVVGGGTLDGTIESFKNSLTDEHTLYKFGGAALVSTALTLMQGKKGLLRTTAQIAGLAMAGAYATDVYGRGGETLKAAKDTFDSPDHAEQNRKVVADVLGPAVVDFGIYTAGGALGTGIGYKGLQRITPNERKLSLSVDPTGEAAGTSIINRQSGRPHNAMSVKEDRAPGSLTTEAIEVPTLQIGNRIGHTRVPTESALAKVYKAGQESVGKVEVMAVNGKEVDGRFGSSVSISADGKMVTNYHVVENAADITIFDAKGNPHKAYTAQSDVTTDLAIVQLRDPKSFDAFKPIKTKETPHTYDATRDGGSAFALGHPDGINNLHVSPAIVASDFQQTPLHLRFLAEIHNGNSGGPLANMDGEMIGIVKSIGERGNATPTWQIQRVMRSTPIETAPYTPNAQPVVKHQYHVEDVKAALGNVENMFGKVLEGETPAAFFHSKAKRIQLEGTGRFSKELILRTQISSNQYAVTVEPIALAGQKLTADAVWPGTDIPISTSRLKLYFDPAGTKVHMESVNDPLGLLNKAFDYRTDHSYLGSLLPIPLKNQASTFLPGANGTH